MSLRFVLSLIVCVPVWVLCVVVGGVAGLLYAGVFLTFVVAVWISDRRR